MKKTTIFLLGIIGILIFLLSLKQCQLDKTSKSISIYKDSTHIFKNLAGELYSTNSGLVLSISDLKKYNFELSNEIKKYKDNPLVVTVIKTKIEYRDTSLKTSTTSYFDTNGNKVFTINWFEDNHFNKDNYLLIGGHSILKIDSTLKEKGTTSSLDSLKIGTKIFLSITEDKENPQLIKLNARSDFPGLSFTDIDGALIDPKKSKLLKSYFPQTKWNVGINAGYGICLDDFKLSPYLGIGIQWRLFGF